MQTQSENEDPSSQSLRLFHTPIKILLLFILFLALFSCGKSKEEFSPSQTESSRTDQRKAVSGSEKAEEIVDDEFSESSSIPIPSNPITPSASERLLEYKIYLVIKSNNLLLSRQEIISIIQKNSILKRMEISFISDVQTLEAEILTPVSNLYPTLLELARVGKLLSEKVETVDWTEHNQKQKIALERETIRAQRRAKAGKEGSAANWTWKDREELLEKSENNYDEAKLETWKIQDSIRWAKIYVQVEGKEVPLQVRFPNFRNTFISSINFIFSAVESIVWFLPILIVLIIIYIFYKRYKDRY